MNVALLRVLYAHALAAAPRLALGRFAPLGRLLGDPRLGMAGVFLSLRRVLPSRYPLAQEVERYIADEQRLGRMLDYAVIVPRLQRLYEWSAEELGEPRLLELVRDGNPIYAWPFEQRHVWRAPKMPLRAGYSSASRGPAERRRTAAHPRPLPRGRARRPPPRPPPTERPRRYATYTPAGPTLPLLILTNRVRAQARPLRDVRDVGPTTDSAFWSRPAGSRPRGRGAAPPRCG